MNEDTLTRPDRAAYLQEKLSSLVEQIDEGYGDTLLEQMTRRMEMTVREFVAEVDQLVERLKHNAATQKELLGRIKQKVEVTGPVGTIPQVGPEDEVPEWERRLADLERTAK